jgi:outer membrane receptor protein involved in Fe transport
MDLAALLLALTLRVVDLQGPRFTELVIVLDEAGMPTSRSTFDASELAETPGAMLDDVLRSTPGFSLFRRSSSRVANPTTQGVTLRGLAASGSSRALVLADDIPLNDPVGGWVYWNRIPVVALEEVSVTRGASGDLLGVDAVGGAITLRSKTTPGLRFLGEAGGDKTERISAFGGRRFGTADVSGSGEFFSTDGYIIAAPEARGPIDVPASSKSGAAHIAAVLRPADTVTTIRGTFFDESRGNGTPMQRNATTVGQIAANLDRLSYGSAAWSIRGHAITQSYEQTFSAVDDDRTSERLTSEQQVDATSFGASGDWVWTTGSRALTVSGATRFVDATVEDTPFAAAGVALTPRIVTPDQLTASLALRGALYSSRWTAGAAVRGELWRTSTDESNSDTFLSPRLWAAYDVGGGAILRGLFQTGHRGPTINELYRPFRVGNIVTNANPLLRPESVRGIEGGVSWRNSAVMMTAAAYWSSVDDAIVNVTQSTGATIVRQRQNAARIRARGFELETQVQPHESIVLLVSTAFTDSTFVAGPLEDLRVPQVPRWHHAVGARFTRGRFRASGEWRFIGRQFDDDRNAFALEESAMTDARAGWMVTPRIEVFGAIENAFDAEQDVGRTPLRTIGLPRTSRVGLRVGF